MIISFFFTLFLCALSKSLIEEKFSEFLTQFNKSYSPLEFKYRLQIFSDNLNEAERLNELEPDLPNKANYGVSPFSDMSPEEFRSLYLLNKTNNLIDHSALLEYVVNQTLIKENLRDNIFDWSQRGKTTPVYNQGRCGSCWAFSVTEQLESMWAIGGHPLEHLAMQQLVDCNTAGSHGCAGGSTAAAWNYIRGNGLERLSCYPYVAHDEACHYNRGCIAAGIRDWGIVGNEARMHNYLLGVGPISVCVDASQWQNYRNGIVRNCGRNVDHCVQITGWDYSYNAWVVRNSWGTGWGVNGYIAIAAYGDVCAIASFPTSVNI